jgi:hypothetical protein
MAKKSKPILGRDRGSNAVLILSLLGKIQQFNKIAIKQYKQHKQHKYLHS